METRKIYERHMRAELRLWKRIIDHLQAEAAGKADAEIAPEYQDELVALQARHDLLRIRLRRLRQAAPWFWREVKDDVDAAWAGLHEILSSAKRFDVGGSSRDQRCAG
jgi:hypothetical protein